MDNMKLLQEMVQNAGTYGDWFLDNNISQDDQTEVDLMHYYFQFLFS